jgi:hypothetical protein
MIIICPWNLKFYSVAIRVSTLWTSWFLITETADVPLLCLSVPVESRALLLPNSVSDSSLQDAEIPVQLIPHKITYSIGNTWLENNCFFLI